MSRIVTLTLNPSLDKSSSVDQVVPDRKLRCASPTFDPGGGGINVARAIHHLGGDAFAYWTCGGPSGALIARLLDDEGVPHQALNIDEYTRENLVVLERSSQRQFRFGMPGAKLNERDLESCIQHLLELHPPAEYLILSGSLPPNSEDDLYRRIVHRMPQGCRIILDTSGPPLKQALQANLFMIKPNMKEIKELAESNIENDAQLEEVCQSLIEQGQVQAILVSLGAAGAMLCSPEGSTFIRAPTVKIRSKIGAGDSTVAGLAWALNEGMSLLEAARVGVASGAAAVMSQGTQLCRKEDVERLYSQMSP